MNKETIELERLTEHRKNYGLIWDETWTENDILNKIVEWSQGKNVVIYRHMLRIEQEDMGGNTTSKFGPLGGPYREETFPSCHRVKYLDIYYQEKL